MGGKTKFLLLLVILAAAGGGVYYWMNRAGSETGAESSPANAPAHKAAPPSAEAPRTGALHPMPGETVSKELPFTEPDYGFAMVVPVGWRVVNWTDPAPTPAGQRRPAYKIRLEDPKSRSLLDLAVYPFTERSRTAVEEIFISKIQAPVPGLEMEIQVDEVVKQGDMRIRRAELRTHDAAGTPGIMRTFYYLSGDKLYTLSLLGSESALKSQDSTVARILDDIKVLG